MFGVQWFSKQGNDCENNRDYGAYVKAGQKHLAIIVDASKKGAKGDLLSKTICDHVIKNIDLISHENSEGFIEVIKLLHQSIRYDFLMETACYSVLCIDNNGVGWTAGCGDCRVGLILGDKKDWINPVHTLSNAIDGIFKEENARSIERHNVTRCWNSKRFVNPETVFLNVESSIICLATDGYWVEHEMLNVPIGNLSDDSSFLVINRKFCLSNIIGSNFLLLD